MEVIRKKILKNEFFKKQPPRALFSVLQKLHESFPETFLAGGCVRDALLGVTAKDFDIATGASPDQVQALFRSTVAVGKQFGVIRVLMDEHEFEVASFRTDGLYIDGRRPSQVLFSSPLEDALRRDFTINALFYDPWSEEIIDYVGGLKDLADKKIACVGDPKSRFNEDALRLLRAIRFQAQLGFSIQDETWQAIETQIKSIEKVSKERLFDEFNKLLKSTYKFQGLNSMNQLGVLSFLCQKKWSSWQKKIDPQSAPQYFPVLPTNFISFLESPQQKTILEAWPWVCFFKWIQSEVTSEPLSGLHLSVFYQKLWKSNFIKWDFHSDQAMSVGMIIKESFELEKYLMQIFELIQINDPLKIQNFIQLKMRFTDPKQSKPWVNAPRLQQCYLDLNKPQDCPQKQKLGQLLSEIYLHQLSGKYQNWDSLKEFVLKRIQ